MAGRLTNGAILLPREEKNVLVRHPVHGDFVAERVLDNLGAVQKAAREWSVRWSEIARECEFKDVENQKGA